FCRSMVCEIGESKSSFYCRGTYIKIGKQITYDLLSYFFIFGKKMRNKIAVISGNNIIQDLKHHILIFCDGFSNFFRPFMKKMISIYEHTDMM
ncbi:hypothetical protein N3930_41360, partial [Bacillus thuringiensis]|nr:hypothetical protein [Bacillus thuringiensis]